MGDIYVIEALRTPFGSLGGMLADVAAAQLASTVIRGLLARSGLDPAAVDDNWNGSPMTRYLSYPVYADIRDQNDVLAGVYATGQTGVLDVVVDEGSGQIAFESPDTAFRPRLTLHQVTPGLGSALRRLDEGGATAGVLTGVVVGTSGLNGFRAI